MARSSLADLDRLALAMPETVREDAGGGRPAYLVRRKSFVLSRTPRADALGEDGRRLTDVLLFRCCGPEDKAGLLEDPDLPFFTTSHFEGYNAVLLREPHIGRVPARVLAEVVADAWLAVAPKRLGSAWLAAQELGGH